MKIKNTFLRLLVLYFGTFSLPLLPVLFRFRGGQGRFLFAWNVFAITSSLYFTYFFMKPLALQSLKRRGDALFVNSSQKPLFEVFFRLGVTFALPIGYFSNYFYFMRLCLVSKPTSTKSFTRSTATLIDLLDFSASVNIPKKIFIVFLASDHLVFMSNYRFIFQTLFSFHFLQFLDIFKFLTIYFALYRLNSCSVAIFGLVAYSKYSTLVELGKVLEIGTKDTLSVEQIECRIRSLATISRRTNRLFSIPLLCILFSQTYNSVILLARTVISNYVSENLLFFVQFLAYLLFLAVLQQLVNHRLADIEHLIIKKLFCKNRNFCDDEVSTGKRKGGYFLNCQVYCRKNQNRANETLCALTMMEVYRKCFQIRLFNLCSLNGRFVRLVVLFVANYIVLVTQTSL